MSSTTSSPAPISRTGRRMAIAGVLLSGGIAIGALFSPIGLAGAQDDPSAALQSAEDDTAVEQTSAAGEPGTRDGMHRHRGRGLAGDPEFLQEFLGLTAEELQTARSEGQTLVETAAAQGVSEADLVAALVEEATARIATAVDEGSLDTDRAAAITDDLETRLTDMVNRTPGDGHGHADREGRGHGRQLFDSSVFADMGLDVDELRTALRDGSTLAEAAAAQGVSEDDLAAALTTMAEERLAQAVADGRVDAERAAEIEADIAQRVQDHLDGIRPEGHGPRGGHGPSDSGASVDGEA